jgi:hypothetical protein
VEADRPIAQHRYDVQEDAAKAEVSEVRHGRSIAPRGVARIARLLQMKAPHVRSKSERYLGGAG